MSSIYPGLVCDGLEIFTRKNQTKFIKDGIVKDLEELPFPIIQTIQAEIANNKKLARELNYHHPGDEWKQIEMFCKCRYGGLDFKADITNNKLNDGDYWDCPLRGNCRSEGIICHNPKYNGYTLTTIEIKLIQLLSTNATNDSISDSLSLPLGSFHLIKKRLYEKLKIQTKQELTKIAFRLNLINV